VNFKGGYSPDPCSSPSLAAYTDKRLITTGVTPILGEATHLGLAVAARAGL
jgi:hypothetical protein